METFLKRKIVQEDDCTDKKQKKQNCPHAEKCYRRNPHHFKEYDHPHLNNFLKKGEPLELPPGYPQELRVIQEQLEILRVLLKDTSIGHPTTNACSSSSTTNSNSKSTGSNTTKSTNRVNVDPNSMSEKMKRNHPYYLFFTKIPESKHTLMQENSVTLTDLLCPSLGQLKCSLQINFMIDIMWLMEQYAIQKVADKPLTVLYGYEFPNMKQYMDAKLPNVTHHLVNMKDPFGTHHSKMGIYCYNDDSIRIVISTANLYYEDWNHYNQGLWISPLCPPLPKSSSEHDGAGPTGFKSTLLSYLESYNVPCLKQWIDLVKRADFSAVKVFLITSVPGKHYPSKAGSHLHRVGDLLSRHCELPVKTTPDSEGPLSWGIIAQASTIGSLGKNAGDWFRSTLLRSLASHKNSPLPNNSNASISVIFPTRDNVMNSYFGADGGGCLPYSKDTHEKQKWLHTYLHQWKADNLHRTRAMPHIKSYCRLSPCMTKLAWFLITSANISKAAWGGNIQKDNGNYVRSYEIGVLFIPKFFDEEYFQIADTAGSNKKLFPFMYDLPLISYKLSDKPWCN